MRQIYKIRVVPAFFLANIFLSGCVTIPEIDMSFLGLEIGQDAPDIAPQQAGEVEEGQEILGETIADERVVSTSAPVRHDGGAPVINRIAQRVGPAVVSAPEPEPVVEAVAVAPVSENVPGMADIDAILSRARQAALAVEAAPALIDTHRQPQISEAVSRVEPEPVIMPAVVVPEQVASIPPSAPTPTPVLSESGLPMPPLFPGERLSSLDKARLLSVAREGIEGGDVYLALENLMRLAEGYAYAPAMTVLAALYLEGEGVSVSPSRAMSYYRRAAELGDSEAQAKLGYYYETGEHLDRDYSAARALYESAAAHDNILAFEGLGRLYEGGLGVGRDENRAAQYFDRAAREARQGRNGVSAPRLRR